MRAKLGLFRQLDADTELVRGLTAALQARAELGWCVSPRKAAELTQCVPSNQHGPPVMYP